MYGLRSLLGECGRVSMRKPVGIRLQGGSGSSQMDKSSLSSVDLLLVLLELFKREGSRILLAGRSEKFQVRAQAKVA